MARRRGGANRFKMWLAGCCAAVTLTASAPALTQAAPKALDEAPANADAVIVVPDLAQLSRDLATLKQTLNLPIPQLDNALGEFKKSSGMAKGFNDHGSLLVVLPDLAQALQTHQQPKFLLLAPVSDFKAFLSNFKPTESAEGVYGLIMPDGESGFAKKADGYAVLGKDKAVVQQFQAGHAADQIAAKIGKAGQQFIAPSDLMLYVNLEKVGPALTPMIEQRFQQVQDKLEHQGKPASGGGATAAAPSNPEAKHIVAAEKDFTKDLLKQATGLLLGLDVDKQGIGLTYAVGYKPDSKIAQILPGRGNGPFGGAVSLEQLPQQPFILALFMDTKAIDLAKLNQIVSDVIPPKMRATLHDTMQQKMALLKETQSIAAAIYPPAQNAMMGGGLLNILAIVQTPNAKNYVQGLEQYIKSINGKSIEVPSDSDASPAPAPAPGAAPQAAPEKQEPAKLTYHTNYQPNVLQLDGTQVDQYQFHMTAPPQMMRSMGPAAALMNYSGYIAAKGGDVVVTTSANPQLVTQGFQTMQAKNGIGAAPAIQKIPQGALPSNLAAKGFVSFTGIAQAANTFTQMMGMPPIQPPADLPPLALGLGIQGHSMASRLYMPMDTLKFVVTTVRDFKQKMGGGQAGQPGQPGASGQPNQGQPGGPPPF